MEAKDDELLTNFGASSAGRHWAVLGGAGWRWVALGTLVLILQLVAGNH